MNLFARGAVAIVVAAATAVGGYALHDTAHADAPSPLGPGLVTVNVDIHYSTFSISTLHVRPGTLVRFLVHNNDPIHHEFIVGDASVHARHEHGTEAVHPPIPGEVSVAPGRRRRDVLRVRRAGPVPVRVPPAGALRVRHEGLGRRRRVT